MKTITGFVVLEAICILITQLAAPGGIFESAAGTRGRPPAESAATLIIALPHGMTVRAKH